MAKSEIRIVNSICTSLVVNIFFVFAFVILLVWANGVGAGPCSLSAAIVLRWIVSLSWHSIRIAYGSCASRCCTIGIIDRSSSARYWTPCCNFWHRIIVVVLLCACHRLWSSSAWNCRSSCCHRNGLLCGWRLWQWCSFSIIFHQRIHQTRQIRTVRY